VGFGAKTMFLLWAYGSDNWRVFSPISYVQYAIWNHIKSHVYALLPITP